MTTFIIRPFCIFLFLCLFILSSCHKAEEFKITGKIENAADKVLYLEQIGISKTTLLDSVVLDASGDYLFKQARPIHPDFYRLRLDNQRINLAVDSTETITVNAQTDSFATDYTLDENNPENIKIKELTLLQIDSSRKYNALSGQFDAGEISGDTFKEEAYKVINAHKSRVREIIGSNFIGLSSYFALFQQINTFLIFDPYNKEDNKLYGAAANAWDLYYPDSPRALQLKNIYLSTRSVPRESSITPVFIDVLDGKTRYDISLPSLTGEEIRMSEACEGKVTLIDFTVYSAIDSPEHNRMLSGIYFDERFKNIAIYQVSLDNDEHTWKNAAVNLPWICVRDPETIHSETIKKYNVTALPTTFIMNKEGEIVFRVENYNDLKKEILKYLN
ncbi:MAG: AhpC/TSA family protein [Dysgonamonadaceae bacterium]|jgi:hypothetical protein|nr:AhpC/TSA family protein [Dysgonamonadaceae bacterium]